MTEKNIVMVFDVESIGLHGEGFWAAWVLIDLNAPKLEFIESRSYTCSIEYAYGTPQGMAWVKQHVPKPGQETIRLRAPSDVRMAFWLDWLRVKRDHEASLAADVSWPVEARFLIDCVDDNLFQREWEGPYPLIDISSVLLSAGSTKTGSQGEDEPTHSALGNAKHSARLLFDAWKELRK